MAGEEKVTIADDLVVTKYKMAAETANKVLKDLVAASIPGASVRDLCRLGDSKIVEETGKAYKKDKKMSKGISFPTCISVNNVVCHYSPLAADPDTVLADGDLVKIDLGAHIDGFIAVVGHSLVVGASSESQVSGRRADVMMAAHLASEAALRSFRPGNNNMQLTDKIVRIARDFGCRPVERLRSYNLERNVIKGEKVISICPESCCDTPSQVQEFKDHEVYAMDIFVSTGTGQSAEKDIKPTVFRKTGLTHMLKMKSSREMLSQVAKNHSVMPFHLNNLEDPMKARMGSVECVSHEVLESYPVYCERDGALVAQFKFTVLMMPNGPMRITGLPFDESLYKSEKKIEDCEINCLLRQSIKPRANKKKKKAAGKEVTEESKPVVVVQEPPSVQKCC